MGGDFIRLQGVVTAYVSVACGYSANIVLSTMDPLLAHTTQELHWHKRVIGEYRTSLQLLFYECFNGGNYGYCLLDYSKWLLPTLGKYEGSMKVGLPPFVS